MVKSAGFTKTNEEIPSLPMKMVLGLLQYILFLKNGVMVPMVDSKLLDEITVSYDVANNVEEKLKIFLSVNNEIKQYHFIIEEKIYKVVIEMNVTTFHRAYAGDILSRLISLMSYKAGGRYFLIAGQEDFYGEFLTYDENYKGLYFQLTFKFPN